MSLGSGQLLGLEVCSASNEMVDPRDLTWVAYWVRDMELMDPKRKAAVNRLTGSS